MTGNPIIWEPSASRIRDSAMYRFMQAQGYDTYADFHRWSIDDAPEFWTA